MKDDRLTPPRTLIASLRHTSILLLILTVVSVAAALQAQRSSGPLGTPSSRLPLYLVLLGVQLLWVRYVKIGMKPTGHAISDFFKPRTGQLWLLKDFAYALVALLAFEAIGLGARYALGGAHARNAFLLPQGPAESALWVFLSLTVGFCEEIVFRGYFQKQIAAIIGNVAGAVVLQAIIFGVLHGYQGWRAATIATAYGLVFGALAWWRGNIRAGVVAHAVTDIVAGLRLL